MAQEMVVKEPLTDAMIAAGKELTSLLDNTQLGITVSLWLFIPEASDWRLVFASPKVGTDGPRSAYEIIQRVLGEAPESVRSLLGLHNITVVDVEDSFIKLLRSAVKTGPGISGIRSSRNRVNNLYVEDAYIYRSQ